jgi:hypothetical protein
MIAISCWRDRIDVFCAYFQGFNSSFGDEHSVRALIAGDLGNHFLHDGAAERLKILRHNDERPVGLAHWGHASPPASMHFQNARQKIWVPSMRATSNPAY